MAINQLSGVNNGVTGLSTPQQTHAEAPAAAPDARAPAGQAAAVPAVNEAELKRSLEEINRFLQPSHGDIEFSQDDETGRTLVKVVDTRTRTVLMQIPSEQALEIAKDLDRFQGQLVRAKV